MNRVYLLALGVALCATSNLLADGPTFTQIDFPGAAGTQAWGITANGDIVGAYVSVDNSTHGFLRTRGEFLSIDFPGAAYTYVNGISPCGDIVGQYAATLNGSGPNHGFMLSRDGVFWNSPSHRFYSPAGFTPWSLAAGRALVHWPEDSHG
jgi:hypothetical protein